MSADVEQQQGVQMSTNDWQEHSADQQQSDSCKTFKACAVLMEFKKTSAKLGNAQCTGQFLQCAGLDAKR